jgi:TPR repeat protein
MKECLPDHILFNPRRSADRQAVLKELDQVARDGKPCVLLLDELEHHLGPDGLSVRETKSLLRLGIVVLGTIRTRLRQTLPAGGLGDEILKLAEEIEMARIWSNEEIDRAEKLFRRNRDPRLRQALGQSADYGIAETLASGPQLWQELHRAARVGGNPRGAALVWASIDLALAGLPGPMNAETLLDLHEHYLPGHNKQLIGPESTEEALRWAGEPRNGVTRFLTPEGDGFRAFDYLVDAHLRDKGPSPALIPERVWEFALTLGKERHHRFDISIAAFANDRHDIGLRALQPLVDSGDIDAVRALGLLYQRHDRETAEKWLHRAIDMGDVTALRLMGSSRMRAGRHDEAHKWYEKAADAGDKESEVFFRAPWLSEVPQAPHDVESTDDDEDGLDTWQPSPRTLRVLEAALDIFADMSYDALERLGDAPVDDGADYPFDHLPLFTWKQSKSWRRQFARCCDDLADEIRSGNWPRPRCTGEEMALHWGLEHAASIQMDQPEFLEWLIDGVPPRYDDYRWHECKDYFFEDWDVLWLYEPWMSGIDDPDDFRNQFVGAANLAAADWFEPFRKSNARDPHRGFRR